MIDSDFYVAYQELRQREGGYTDGKNQVSDEPTNIGIKQSTLRKYICHNPEADMPSDVRNLTVEQAALIYKSFYWDNTKIPCIKSKRIRNAFFDMNVMSGLSLATRTIQKAINLFIGSQVVQEDGILGSKTLEYLNGIIDINAFMDILKSVRLKSLKKMQNWPSSGRGWTVRTQGY